MKFKIAVVAAAMTSVTSAHADLNNPNYVQAKAAYAQQDCARANPLLKKYLQEDAVFLQAHPDERSKIDAAFARCETALHQTMKPTTVTIVGHGRIVDPTALPQEKSTIGDMTEKRQFPSLQSNQPNAVSLRTR